MKWSQKEIEILKDKYHSIPIKEMESFLPGRKWKTISVVAKRLGIANKKNKDYTNKKIGIITIIEKVKIEDKISQHKKRTQWNAICDCGNRVIFNETQLRRALKLNIELSCGCKRRVHSPLFFRDPKQTNFNNYLSHYKTSASERNLEWNLTKEEFEQLIYSNCYYCGVEPENNHNVFNKRRYKNVISEEAKARQLKGIIKTNGIDRMNHTIGYILDNCVPCCKNCNYAKGKMTKEDFLKWINRIIIFQSNK